MESSRGAPVRSSTIGLTMLAGVIALSALGIGPARAQYGYEPDLLMPPRAVVWRLNDRGFTDVSRPRFDGRAYVVEATGPYGDRVRLFVDARDGAVLGRQRLDATAPPPVRVARPAAPGYGWTEDDEQTRRPMREAERLIPPSTIPNAEGYTRQPRFDMAARPNSSMPGSSNAGAPSRGEPADRNPLGLNPDSTGPELRTGESRRSNESQPQPPRKVAKLTPPAKALAPKPASDAKVAPDASRPAETASPSTERKSEPSVAAIAPPKAEPSTPAALQPNRDAVQAPPAKAQAWSDPPSDKKPVRVIGGATIVPGASEKEQTDRPAD